MTTYQINLLERISAGQRKFAALGKKLADYDEFTQQANVLIALERDGYIMIKNKRREKLTGQNFYYEFLVDRITRAGLEAIGRKEE